MANYQYDKLTKYLLESFEFDDVSFEDEEEMSGEFFEAETNSSAQDYHQELLDTGYYDNVINLLINEIIRRIHVGDYYEKYIFDSEADVKKMIIVTPCESDKTKSMVNYIIIPNESSILFGMCIPLFIINDNKDDITLIECFDFGNSLPFNAFDCNFCGTLYNNSFAYLISLPTMMVIKQCIDNGFKVSIGYFNDINSPSLLSNNLFVNPKFDDSIYSDTSFKKDQVDEYLKAVYSAKEWFNLFGKYRLDFYHIIGRWAERSQDAVAYNIVNSFYHNVKNPLQFSFKGLKIIRENACIFPSISDNTKELCKSERINHDEYCGKCMIAKAYTLNQYGMDPFSN